MHSVSVSLVRVFAVGCLMMLAACSDDGGTASEVVTSTTATVSRSADPDETAARAFIDAWRRGDADAMRELAPADQVDVAMKFGTAVGEPECTTAQGGQYQCDVNVSNGKRMYLLVGEPGGSPGRVWWVSENDGD
jgi:hypothetical protein